MRGTMQTAFHSRDEASAERRFHKRARLPRCVICDFKASPNLAEKRRKPKVGAKISNIQISQPTPPPRARFNAALCSAVESLESLSRVIEQLQLSPTPFCIDDIVITSLFEHRRTAMQRGRVIRDVVVENSHATRPRLSLRFVFACAPRPPNFLLVANR